MSIIAKAPVFLLFGSPIGLVAYIHQCKPLAKRQEGLWTSEFNIAMLLAGCASMTDSQRRIAQGTAAGTGIQVSQTPGNELKMNVPGDFSFDTGSAYIKPNAACIEQFSCGFDEQSVFTSENHRSYRQCQQRLMWLH